MVPKVTSSLTLLETPYFLVKRERVEWPDGFCQEWYFMESPPFVVVIVFHEEKLLLVRQYRHMAQRKSLEFPAGLIEPGELPQHAVERELFEETGTRVDTMKPLGIFYGSIGRLRGPGHVFLAEGARLGNERKLDEGERDLEVVLASRDEWRVALSSGEIICGPTLCAWALYCAHQEVPR